MTAHHGTDETPLVVHVIPTPLGRGAQRAARALVDRLNEPGLVRHQLLGLFDGPPEVIVDQSLGYDGRRRPAVGFAPALAVRLRTAVSRLDPAVVVAHGGDAMKYLVPAVLGTRRPLVYCVIGTYAGSSAPLQLWRWRLLMARADLTVAVGDEALDECIRRFGVDPDRAVMIANGRDPTVFHPRTSETGAVEGTTITFVGALTAQKRPDRFIDVVARLRSEGRGFQALLVGDGPLRRSLAGVASTHGVELLGARSDVPDLLRRADVLVLPSEPTGEGMPGVLIEAGLSGVPAVSTSVPGARTVIADGRTGLIVDGSVGAFASAIGRLLDDPVRRAAMGAAARSRCESMYSLDVMADRWRSALRPLVDAQRRTGGRRETRGNAAARRASALRRRSRSRRGSSHS
ncbi:MAG TPA: glycosyltransferase family 4 protein [Acidimicrobiales bacterium]|nr:glycosyltransferase family 4 protein [Acidimicrobiales bacterium]